MEKLRRTSRVSEARSRSAPVRMLSRDAASLEASSHMSIVPLSPTTQSVRGIESRPYVDCDIAFVTKPQRPSN